MGGSAHAWDSTTDILIKNSHFFWNIATVRAIVPGQFKNEELFKPLEEALSRYPKEKWELVIGTADQVDPDTNTVKVGDKTFKYDQLVLATGTRYSNSTEIPWKANNTYEEATKMLDEIREKVKLAKHIVVAGAGSTGIEVAGELGFEYGGKKGDEGKEIVLLSADADVLGGDSVAGAAKNELKKLHVAIKMNSRVKDVAKTPEGKTEVALENGEKIVTDLYLPTMGLLPNSEYLDAKFLNEKKNVIVDEFHKLKGTENVWAAGDIVSKPRAGFMITQKQVSWETVLDPIP